MAYQTQFHRTHLLLRKTGQGKIIGGCILLGFAVIYIILGLSDELEVEEGESLLATLLFVILIFGVTGALLLFFGIRDKNNLAKHRKYLSIVGSGIFAVADIAAKMSVPEQRAYADLQKMLNRGFFPGAYLDLQNQTLAFPGSNKVATMVCSKCGATNTVSSREAVCEYCGSQLQ